MKAILKSDQFRLKQGSNSKNIQVGFEGEEVKVGEKKFKGFWVTGKKDVPFYVSEKELSIS